MKDLIVLSNHKCTKSNQCSRVQHKGQVFKNELWSASLRNQARLIQKLYDNISMPKHESTTNKTTLVEFVHFITVTCCCWALCTHFVEAARDGPELFISFIYFCPIKPCYHVWVLDTLKLVPLFSCQRSKSLLKSYLLFRSEQLLPCHPRLFYIISPYSIHAFVVWLVSTS